MDTGGMLTLAGRKRRRARSGDRVGCATGDRNPGAQYQKLGEKVAQQGGFAPWVPSAGLMKHQDL